MTCRLAVVAEAQTSTAVVSEEASGAGSVATRTNMALKSATMACRLAEAQQTEHGSAQTAVHKDSCRTAYYRTPRR
jgi:hypothetical protein